MQKQNYTLCCKNACYKQDNSQWPNFVGCKSHATDMRKRTCTTGPSKGFVQNLKDKLVNLQNDSRQLQFVKKPVKKKQKDYYCLMLRKINNLDKKLQNLENLFVSHINHAPNEVFNSGNNDPLCNYMDFYESVRSLVDLANTLKEDILYKQSNNNMPHRNVLHINDQIQVLDSGLKNLYTYLDQLQNCASEIKDAKQYFVKEDYLNVPCSYSEFRGDPKANSKRCNGYNGGQSSNKNKRNNPKMCRPNENNYSVNHPTSNFVECFEVEEGAPLCCQCSMCNINANIFSMAPPRNRRYSPTGFEYCYGGPTGKNSDCLCEICVNERNKMFKLRNNNLWASQSSSSCSCEICVTNNKKSYTNKNCNNARIKIIKPPKNNLLNKGNFVSELQISYHELGPSNEDTKMNQRNKRGKLNENEEYQDTDLETVYYQDIGTEPKVKGSPNAFNVKSEEIIILEKNNGKKTKSKYSKTTSTSNKQESVKPVKNVVYYELTPDLNIITKRKNNTHVYSNSAQNHDKESNKSTKKNKNKVRNAKDKSQRYDNFRVHTGSFNLNEEEFQPSKSFPTKVVKNKRISDDYTVIDKLSSENEYEGTNFYQTTKSDKKIPAKPKTLNKTDDSTGKHLHIKFRTKKETEEGMTFKQNIKRSPKYGYNYTNNHSQFNHQRHGGFCHFQNSTVGKQRPFNKRFPHCHPCHTELSDSDSFETVEVNGSDCDSCSSQYKLFFCNDPNCVEKLNSDELIMLMNKIDLKSCDENRYQLSVSESVKDFKSDVCEKCTIKENTISLTPIKKSNRDKNEKSRVIVKRALIECINCKNEDSDILSGTFKTNGSSGLEKNRNERGESKNTSSKTNKGGSNIKNHYKEMEKICSGSSCERENQKGMAKICSGSSCERENQKGMAKICSGSSCERENQKGMAKICSGSSCERENQKINKYPTEKDLPSSSSFSRGIDHNSYKKNNNIENKGKSSKNLIIEYSNLDPSRSFKTLEGNENFSGQVFDLQRLNEINTGIDIEKGPHSLNQQTGIINVQKGMDEEIHIPDSNSSGNKNMNLGLTTVTRDYEQKNAIDSSLNRQLLTNDINESLPNTNNVTDNTFINRPKQDKTLPFFSGNNKSSSALDLAKRRSNEIKEVMSAKSEICTKAPRNSNITEDGVKNHLNKNIKIVQYAAQSNNGVFIENKRKRVQPKNCVANKEISLNYAAEKSPKRGNILLNSKDPHYTYENGNYTLPKKQSGLKKRNVRVSATRLNRSRIKFNKGFGSSLNKVSSMNSVIVQNAKLYPEDDSPWKKSVVFNPGRRNNKMSKRRHNKYSRISSLSGIIKPQVNIVDEITYRNDFKIPSNVNSDSRYKISSISNYLSSTIETESSYSTLNWGKVAQKLKEDDNYYNNNIA